MRLPNSIPTSPNANGTQTMPLILILFALVPAWRLPSASDELYDERNRRRRKGRLTARFFGASHDLLNDGKTAIDD